MSLIELGQFSSTSDNQFAQQEAYNPLACSCLAGSILNDVTSYAAPITWQLKVIANQLNLSCDLNYRRSFNQTDFKDILKVSLVFKADMSPLIAVYGVGRDDALKTLFYTITDDKLVSVASFDHISYLAFLTPVNLDNRLVDQIQTAVFIEDQTCVVAELVNNEFTNRKVIATNLSTKDEIHRVGLTLTNQLKVELAERV